MRIPFVVVGLLTACNLPPEALQVAITPESPTTVDDLVAEVTGPTIDADGDEITQTFTWYVDGEPRPDLNSLTVPASETAKHQEWKLFVQPSDGQLDGPPSEATVTILNTPPTVEVSLSPGLPLTTEDVVAAVTGADPDGDEVLYTYAWTLDGDATGYQDSTLPASATERGDVWTLSVTPSDGEADGETVLASVSIENTAPEVTRVTLDPNEPQEADTITASVEHSDADGDPVSYSYAWTVDDEVVLEGDHPTITGEHFDKGQQVHVTVTANDGFVDGASMDSDPVTVRNTAPSVSAAAVDPSEIHEATTLSCLGEGWADDDDDPESYQVTWTVNGVEVSIEQTLAGEHFDRGDNITCTLVPDDGGAQGEAVESQPVTVLNTAPVISAVSLSPTSPTEGDTVTATVTVSDDDGDTISLAYAWYVGGALVATTETIDSTMFDKHQSIQVEITPSDDADTGLTVTSAIITAVNTPPVIGSVALTPSALYTDDTVTAEVTTSDADGDAVTHSYAWTVDGAAMGVTTASLDGSAYFDKHQIVAVTVTPNDGETDGSPISAAATVFNSPPTAPTLAIEPEEPEAEVDDLICSIEVDSTDADDDPVTYTFSWQVDGVAYGSGGGMDSGDTGAGWSGPATTSAADDTVPGGDTRDDEVWTCEVTPNDGEDDGSTASVSVTTEYLVEPHVTAGSYHSCYVNHVGTAWCWGRDTSGESTVPETDFIQIDAGRLFTCGVDGTNSLQCWGDNSTGQLGAPFGTYIQVDASPSSNQIACAIGSAGSIDCWGSSASGASSPPSGTFTKVGTGESFACGLSSGGAIQCWGSNSHGEQETPTGTFVDLALGQWHACAIDTTGAILCWGWASHGLQSPPSGNFVQVSSGYTNSCAIDTSSAIQCWGNGFATSEGHTETPPAGSFRMVSVGYLHACALDTAGAVHCWGREDQGQTEPPPEIAAP